MNALKKLSEEHIEKPYHGFTKLRRGYHKIVTFRLSHGKYGRGIIAELKKEILFLPQYLVEKLDDEDIVELNSSEENLYLFFGGSKKKGKKTK